MFCWDMSPFNTAIFCKGLLVSYRGQGLWEEHS